MRLIDADEFYNDIEFRTVNCQNDLTLEDLQFIKSEIDTQPTVYDIDKVVEELESLAEKGDDCGDCSQVWLRDVIKIVKAGGENDD